jgi:hypothetical protein
MGVVTSSSSSSFSSETTTVPAALVVGCFIDKEEDFIVNRTFTNVILI